MKPIAGQIEDRIKEHDPEWCFSPKDFMDLAGRDGLDQAFSRLCRSGNIRRIGRGLYDVPRYSELLKTTLGPSPDQAAEAIARKHGWRIQPTGINAANQLHLSTQVPGQIFYLSDGPTKTVKIGNTSIHFKHKTPKDLISNPLSALVIQALKYLGREQVDEQTIRKIREQLTEEQIRQLLDDARFVTDWIVEVIHEIARTNEDFCNE